jgi:hypothetical protein
MTNSEIGALLLVLFGVFYWLNIFATIRALAAFIGTILVGSNGHLVHWLTIVVLWASHLGGTITGWAFGVALPAAFAIVTAVVFIHDLHPKHPTQKRTGWAGVVLGLLIVAGATGVATLNNVGPAVQSGVTSVQQSG